MVLILDVIIHTVFHLKQDILHILDHWPIHNMKFISLHVFDSKWNLHFNNVNDYVRSIGNIHIPQNKNIILV